MILYFRHSATDPVPDDEDPVVLGDCSTQRMLSAAGRSQAQGIGRALAALRIPIGQVLSNPYSRAIDTARLAFGRSETEPALQDLETAQGDERAARIDVLQRLLSRVPARGRNNVLVAHGVNITAAAQVPLPDGGAAVFRPEGGRWVRLGGPGCTRGMVYPRVVQLGPSDGADVPGTGWLPPARHRAVA
jgi:phosphohistidine phosphatase SixA